MPNNHLKKDLYQLGILTLVVVVIWIVYAVYYAYKNPIDIDTKGVNLEPLQPQLYLDLANKLENRTLIPEVDLQTLDGNTPIIISTSSASPIATSSG